MLVSPVLQVVFAAACFLSLVRAQEQGMGCIALIGSENKENTETDVHFILLLFLKSLDFFFFCCTSQSRTTRLLPSTMMPRRKGPWFNIASLMLEECVKNVSRRDVSRKAREPSNQRVVWPISSVFSIIVSPISARNALKLGAMKQDYHPVVEVNVSNGDALVSGNIASQPRARHVRPLTATTVVATQTSVKDWAALACPV